MPRSKRVGWILLIVFLFIMINLIPGGDSREPNVRIQIITASAALMQVDGLLRNISQINGGCTEWLVRANTALMSRGYWNKRRVADNWGGLLSMPDKVKVAPECYYCAIMVISLFFAFFQSSRSLSGVDDGASAPLPGDWWTSPATGRCDLG